MAEAAVRAAARTVLEIEGVEVEVGLFPTSAKPAALAEFETAGPHGGRLVYQQRAKPTGDDAGPDLAEARGGRTDPLASDPGPEGGRAMADAIVGAEARRAESTGDPFPQTTGEFRQVLVEEGTDEEVEREQVRRGVRLADGRFVDCTEQLARIEERTRLERMSVVRFLDVGQVDRTRVVGSYYVGATHESGKRTLRLLLEAMRLSRRVAEAKWTARSRQSRGVILPYADRPSGAVGLVALKLAWEEDVRRPPAEASLVGVDVSPRMVAAARELVRAWSVRPGDVEPLRDDAVALREELFARALAGEMDAEVVGPESAPDVVADDLEARLEAAVARAKA